MPSIKQTKLSIAMKNIIELGGNQSSPVYRYDSTKSKKMMKKKEESKKNPHNDSSMVINYRENRS